MAEKEEEMERTESERRGGTRREGMDRGGKHRMEGWRNKIVV